MEDMGLKNLLEAYRNKKVLITGHTGFKGSWLTIWLHTLGAKVTGIALDPRHEKDNYVLSGIGSLMEKDYRQDIRDLEGVKAIFAREKPEIVFHLAAQPIVIDGYRSPVYTYETNVMGTVNLLEACRECSSVHTAVFITTDKCYDNKEWVYPYREIDPMGGFDPYSSSKGAAELIISSYRNAFLRGQNIDVASARAGNVIGGGDWSPYRIVVDLIKAIESGSPLEVRSPNAIRPWQHVLEPLSGYLLLGAKMTQEKGQYDEAWNFGPESQATFKVRDLVETLIDSYGAGEWIDRSDGDHLHEANLLSLDISKARNRLKWRPVLSFRETVEFTVDWYQNYSQTDVLELCRRQIQDYCDKWSFITEN